MNIQNTFYAQTSMTWSNSDYISDSPNPATTAPDATVRDYNSFNTPWVACFLIDGVIMVRPDPGSDAAKIIWSDRTVC